MQAEIRPHLMEKRTVAETAAVETTLAIDVFVVPNQSPASALPPNQNRKPSRLKLRWGGRIEDTVVVMIHPKKGNPEDDPYSIQIL